MSTTATANDTTAGTGASAHGGKYLTFALGAEEYGIQILKVREIVGYLDITAVPRTAAHVRGVVNLRGQVIPVIDLRARFGMAEAERTDRTCIIVLDARRAGRRTPVGVVVDRVREVLDVPGTQIEEPPAVGDVGAGSDFILGMGKVGNSVKILLDIDRVLGSDSDELSMAA
jgi:purine-binding chemotaxis protein CheW